MPSELKDAMVGELDLVGHDLCEGLVGGHLAARLIDSGTSVRAIVRSDVADRLGVL